jgi:purine-binding chemotaxis protein CheW
MEASVHIDKEKKNAKGQTSQIIVFRLGSEEYGLHIEQIKEVVVTPSITKVPLTAGFIKGVANVRGNILAIIDLEERLGLESSFKNLENGTVTYSLIVENEEFRMGILVKDVPNTLTITEEQIDQSPNIIHDHSMDKNYIKGIVKLNNRLIILIDIYKIISKEDVSNSLTQTK